MTTPSSIKSGGVVTDGVVKKSCLFQLQEKHCSKQAKFLANANCLHSLTKKPSLNPIWIVNCIIIERRC